MTTTQKRITAIITFLSITTVVGIAAAVYQYSRARNYRSVINHSYSRSLAELTDSVSDIGFSLEKGLLVSSPSQVVRLSNEINRHSNSAMANLGQLPLSGVQMDNTEKFLSQVGDYTNSLAMRVSLGGTISEEDYANLKNLSDYCDKLAERLEETQDSFYDGKLSIERLKNESKKENSQFLDDVAGESEKDFADYPSLVYDGPFSAHIDTVEYSVLQNLNEVSEEQARTVLKEFIGNDSYIIKSAGEKEGRLPSYTFEIYPEKSGSSNYLTAEVTKKGGKLAWFLNNYCPNETNISVTQAIENAKNFLYTHGYNNMKESYYDCRNNVATINFAYTQGDIIMYPDLIKVKIAMDSGQCIGLEAGGYLMNNKDRSDYAPTISPSQARASVSSLASIDSVQLAVIPTDSMREILCYELKGHIDDRNYLVYVNAETGVQEQVLVLIESENGILTT